MAGDAGATEPRDFGPGGAARRRIDARFQSVSHVSRDVLRNFVAEPRNSGACTPADQELLKALPIFRVHGGASSGGAGSGRYGRSRGGEGGVEHQYTSVSGAEKLYLAPERTDPKLLGPEFAVDGSSNNKQLLQGLGVEKLTKAAFVRDHVLPRAVAGNLPPREYDQRRQFVLCASYQSGRLELLSKDGRR